MIRMQAQAAKMTRDAFKALIRTASYVPEDRLDWSPMGSARSVMSQLVECVQFAEGLAVILTAEIMPPLDRDALQKRRDELIERYKTAEAIAELAEARGEELARVIESTPDSRLEEEFKLPFFERLILGVDLVFLGYWNVVYHTGQINYLQMMLGDTVMH
jgi:hypothetical protein